MSLTKLVFGTADGLALGSFLFTLVMFLLLVWLLRIYAFGPLMKMMRDREVFVQNQIDTAEESRKEAALLLEEQKVLIRQVRQEASDHIEAAKKQGEVERKDIIELANKEAKEMIKMAKSDIELEKKLVIQELYEHASTLTISLATKVLEREINEDDHKHFMEKFLQEVGRNHE